ncbi:putative proteasome component pre6 protein [Zalerion maritima]|uniref:Proteasome component pre6 protein n=1 Tax=Zalerion maritima TaxID=339359 RepID=A0AAD5RYI0_9PEZI|nr:putative proteasome component pre6 protein [Zalerion maritima]
MSYDRALSVFSPDGHVFQVEYAGEAVKRGTTPISSVEDSPTGLCYANGLKPTKGTCAVGVKGKELVVLGCEKKSTMKLQDTRITPSKIGLIDTHVCLAFAGLHADARILVDKARLEAQSHRLTVEDPVTIEYITKYVAGVQQRYTQSGGVRPFGISSLIVGFDKGSDVPKLYQTEPSGIFSAWKANAIGRAAKTVREFLERNYKEDMDREDTIRLSIKSLLEVVQTGAKNIEIAIMAPGKTVEMLPMEDIETYVKAIEQEKKEEAAKKKTGRTPGTGSAAILTRPGGSGSREMAGDWEWQKNGGVGGGAPEEYGIWRA